MRTTGLGIAAFVLALVSLAAPIFVNFAFLWIAMSCASFALMSGDKPLPVASAIIGLSGLLLLSPATMAAIALSLTNDSYRLSTVAFAPFFFPVMAYWFHSVRGESRP